MPTSYQITTGIEPYSLSKGGSRPYYYESTICVPILWLGISTATAAAYCSVDGGATWAEYDAANAPATARLSGTRNNPAGSVQVDDYVYVFTFRASDRLMAVDRFSMSSLEWEHMDDGGPALYGTTSTASRYPQIEVTHYNGTFTACYRGPNEVVSSQQCPRTRAVRWTVAGGWQTPIDTFGQVGNIVVPDGADNDFFANSGTIDDGSGNTIMVARWDRGIISPPNARTLYQVLNADNTLGPVGILQETDLPGADAQEGSLPGLALIGGKLTAGQVYNLGNRAISGLPHLADPTLVYWEIDPVESPTLPVANLEMDVDAALYDSSVTQPAQNAAVLSGESRTTVGMVTRERADAGGSDWTIAYHDITDIATTGQKLFLWTHYRNSDSGLDYPKVWGAYFNDSGLIGSPFTVYENLAGQIDVEVRALLVGYPECCCPENNIIF